MRRSPGSPSQMIAALLRRAVADVAIEAVDARRSACRRRTTSRRATSTRAPSSHGLIHSSSRGEAGPERLGIGGGAVVDRRIVDVRGGGERGGGGKVRSSVSSAEISARRIGRLRTWRASRVEQARGRRRHAPESVRRRACGAGYAPDRAVAGSRCRHSPAAIAGGAGVQLAIAARGRRRRRRRRERRRRTGRRRERRRVAAATASDAAAGRLRRTARAEQAAERARTPSRRRQTTLPTRSMTAGGHALERVAHLGRHVLRPRASPLEVAMSIGARDSSASGDRHDDRRRSRRRGRPAARRARRRRAVIGRGVVLLHAARRRARRR